MIGFLFWPNNYHIKDEVHLISFPYKWSVILPSADNDITHGHSLYKETRKCFISSQQLLLALGWQHTCTYQLDKQKQFQFTICALAYGRQMPGLRVARQFGIFLQYNVQLIGSSYLTSLLFITWLLCGLCCVAVMQDVSRFCKSYPNIDLTYKIIDKDKIHR